MLTKPLRVCQLCAVDFTLKNFLLPLIDGMRERGWEVVAVCSDGPSIASLRNRGYSIETVKITRSMNLWVAFRSLLALIRLFRCERFDILHVHTPVAALIGRLAAWLTRTPMVIYTAHGFYFHDDMPRWKYRLFVMLERIGGCWTNLLFTQSSEDARTAVAEKIMLPEQVLAIGNGVNVERFSPDKVGSGNRLRKSLGIPVNAYVVGFIGRQVREKGIVELLNAVEQLAKEHLHLWVLLVGERLPSDHAAGLSREFALAKKTLGDRLVAPGLRNDIPELLAIMDLFCLPSWREGMPRTIIEAMMMAKPVVATNIRGSREEVIHEETGLLVPIDSTDILAETIERFITNPAWGKRLGIAGRDRALKLYNESTVVSMQLDRIEKEWRQHEAII